VAPYFFPKTPDIWLARTPCSMQVRDLSDVDFRSPRVLRLAS
jgi:hypothetical protein